MIQRRAVNVFRGTIHITVGPPIFLVRHSIFLFRHSIFLFGPRCFSAGPSSFWPGAPCFPSCPRRSAPAPPCFSFSATCPFVRPRISHACHRRSASVRRRRGPVSPGAQASASATTRSECPNAVTLLFDDAAVRADDPHAASARRFAHAIAGPAVKNGRSPSCIARPNLEPHLRAIRDDTVDRPGARRPFERDLPVLDLNRAHEWEFSCMPSCRLYGGAVFGLDDNANPLVARPTGRNP